MKSLASFLVMSLFASAAFCAADMNLGNIICDEEDGSPLCSQTTGEILYHAPCQKMYLVTVSWGEDDLDICAHWNMGSLGESVNIGWGWNNGCDFEEEGPIGYSHWQGVWSSGDNTHGGPEYVMLGIDNPARQSVFEIGCNWYRGSGSATITVESLKGEYISKSTSVSPSSRKGEKAERGDGGAYILFNSDGNLKDVRAK